MTVSLGQLAAWDYSMPSMRKRDKSHNTLNVGVKRQHVLAAVVRDDDMDADVSSPRAIARERERESWTQQRCKEGPKSTKHKQ